MTSLLLTGGRVTPADYTDHRISSFAGDLSWGAHRVNYFLDHDNVRYFVVLPWWGRRIVLDLTHGRYCDSLAYEYCRGETGRFIREYEAELARRVLVNAVEHPETFGSDDELFGRGDPDLPASALEPCDETLPPLEMPTAIYECGELEIGSYDAIFHALNIIHEQHLADTVDLVASFECAAYLGGVDSTAPGYRFLRPYLIPRVANLRCISQRVLRAFGRTPSQMPGYLSGGWLQKGEAATFGGLRSGADRQTVLQIAGAPTYVREDRHWEGQEFYHDEYWEYDFGVGETGKTVSMVWLQDSGGKLTRIDELKTPIWRDPVYLRRLVEP